jgi:signal transduction histidine kinase
VSGELRAPLTARLRRFWVALDYVVAAGCAVIIFGVLFHSTDGTRFAVRTLATPGWLLLLMLAIALSFPVAIRRRAPARALLLVLAACVVTLILGGEITRGPFLPLGVVLYLVASTCRRTIAVAGLAAALALLVVQGVALHFSGVGSGNAVGVGLVLTIFWMIGYAVQQRRTHLAHLRDRAASDAVTRERLRIARELHDVVAHSMTVVTVQAGFGEYVFDSQPAEARAALGAIQAVSREALGEMQRMLCVLRQQDAELTPAVGQPAAGPDSTGPDSTRLDGTGPDSTRPDSTRPDSTRPDSTRPDSTRLDGTGPGSALSPAWLLRLRPAPAQVGGAATAAGDQDRPRAPLAPAPGLASLDRLVERTAGAGVKVTVERTGRVRALPTGLDLSAFRIVQEALTNVVKHSGADSCHVVLHYGASFLLVKVLDGGPAAPAGPAPPAGVLAGAGAWALSGNGSRPAAGPRAAPGPGSPGTPPRTAAVAGRASAGRAPASAEPRAGHGIIGMRERVSLCGGEFTAGPRPEGGFMVRARLPLAGVTS